MASKEKEFFLDGNKNYFILNTFDSLVSLTGFIKIVKENKVYKLLKCNGVSRVGPSPSLF